MSCTDKEATIEFIFAPSPSVISLITKLEKHFTSYGLNQVSSLSSTYAVRLYELIIA
ncbi:RepB family plasmid replication initiator protein [Candidatus Nitrosacidococcus tergens]